MDYLKPIMLAASVALIALPAAPAAAQSAGSFAVGGSLSARSGTDSGTSGHSDVGLLWRFGHGHDGWGWQYGLGWYAADLVQPVGTGVADFGELHVRPFVGGYGYSKQFGRTQLTGRLLAGYAVNSFEMRPTFDDAYRRAFGAGTVTTEVSNSFVVRPEVSAWIDLTRKVGLNVSVGYVVARPEVTVSSTVGTDTRHIRADVVLLKIGAVYSVF
jgi:hypothetical protein